MGKFLLGTVGLIGLSPTIYTLHYGGTLEGNYHATWEGLKLFGPLFTLGVLMNPLPILFFLGLFIVISQVNRDRREARQKARQDAQLAADVHKIRSFVEHIE